MEIYLVKRPSQSYKSKEFITHVLMNYYEIMGEIRILTNDFGKPFIDGNPFYFSCSHSYNIQACAIDLNNVGLDIQKRSKLRKGIVERYFTDREKDFLFRTQLEDDNFSIIWTRKEALGKWIGCGLTEETMAQDSIQQSMIRTYSFNDFYLSFCTSGADSIDVSFFPTNFQTTLKEIYVSSL